MGRGWRTSALSTHRLPQGGRGRAQTGSRAGAARRGSGCAEEQGEGARGLHAGSSRTGARTRLAAAWAARHAGHEPSSGSAREGFGKRVEKWSSPRSMKIGYEQGELQQTMGHQSGFGRWTRARIW
jgi:hypothetical protein